jgi:hypothetical protein
LKRYTDLVDREILRMFFMFPSLNERIWLHFFENHPSNFQMEGQKLAKHKNVLFLILFAPISFIFFVNIMSTFRAIHTFCGPRKFKNSFQPSVRQGAYLAAFLWKAPVKFSSGRAKMGITQTRLKFCSKIHFNILCKYQFNF